MENFEVNRYSKKHSVAASRNVKERNYWLNQLSGEFVKTSFPRDYKKITEYEYVVNTLNFKLDGECFSKLNTLSNGSEIRLNIILITGLIVLLYKYTASKDIILGSPICKQDIEGDFINTILAVRTQVIENLTFQEFLVQVGKTFYEAIQNQNYPIETMLPRLNIPVPETGGFPLFDIAIMLENIHRRDYLHNIKLDMIFIFLKTDQFIIGEIEYNASLYKETTIQGIISHFRTLLDKALTHQLNLPLFAIDILMEKEKKQILRDFNHSQTQYPKDRTIHNLFAGQVKRTPDHIALKGLSEKRLISKFNHITISYKELDEISDQLAHILKERNSHPDTIIAIMIERCVGMIIGILAILKARGAYLPIDPHYPENRIKHMLTDSRANVLITTRDLYEDKNIGRWEAVENLEIVFLTSAKGYSYFVSSLPGLPPSHSSDLAYVLYTSGTTGKSKGVLIQHNNVVRLLFNDKFLFNFNSNDVWTLFHSYNFDFSVWEVWGALLYGGQLMIIPHIVALDQNRFLQVLLDQKVTVLNQTPSAFYSLADQISEPPLPGLKIKYIIFGGEALKPAKLKKWNEKFPKVKLINMYGITETTVHVTYKEIAGNEIKSNQCNIGKPIPTLSTYIMDKNMRLVPPGIPGELCVGGEGMARGYLNQPEMTRDKFVKNPYNSKECIYRSGDLAKLIHISGDIEYLGRIDHQVKIRGYRIELGEIESLLLKHDKVKEAVVVVKEKVKSNSLEIHEDKYLCAYIVSNGNPSVAELREHLTKELPNFMIPTFFVQLKSIPLTPNCKIDMKALPLPESVDDGEYMAPRNELEKKLIEIWSEVLVEDKNKIGIDSNFFHLGGHSLMVIMLVSRINKALNKKVPLIEIFRLPTIRELAKYMSEKQKDKYISIESVEEKEYYPLSSNQKRLYIIHQLSKTSIAYNQPQFVGIEGELDKKRLTMSFRQLLERHESLRTSFLMLDNEPVQRILHSKKVEFALEYYDASETEEAEVVRKFIHSFDLRKAPLLRTGLIKNGENRFILAVDMHHIVSDGISIQILIKDFMTFYRGEKLPVLRIQYKDYSRWQNRLLGGLELKKQENYWLEVFAGEVPVMNNLNDFPRLPEQDSQGNSIRVKIEKRLTHQLREIAKKTGTTPYMILLAVYNVLLSKYTGNVDIVVGSGISGRTHADLERVIGMFVNMLPMRNRPEEDKTFSEFLEEVKQNTISAFENQDYPFDQLVMKLGVQREYGRNPLFDTQFTYQNMEEQQLVMPGISLRPYSHRRRARQFDLSLSGIEKGEIIFLIFSYKISLFKCTTVERLGNHFIEILEQLVKNQHLKLKDINMSQVLVTTPSQLRRMDALGFKF